MSKTKLKRSVSLIKKEKVNWKQQLRQLDLNTIRKDRTVEFIVLNECLPKYFDDIVKFQKQAYLYTSEDIKPVIYEEILYIITHYPAWNRPYIDKYTEDMIKEACAEAKNYLKVKKPIPLELIADLIKLRVIMLIQEDVYNENMLKMNLLSETMSTEMSNSCDTSSNLSDEDDEKKVDNAVEQKVERKSEAGVNVQFMETNVMQNNDYTDDHIHEYDTVDVFFSSCSLILQEYVRTVKKRKQELLGQRRRSGGFTPVISTDDIVWIRKREQLRTPWSIRHCQYLNNKNYKSTINIHTDPVLEEKKLLYIVLTGFYDVYIIILLHKVGVPIRCVLSIAMKDDTPLDPTLPFNIKTSTLVSPYSVVPVYHYSLQCLYTQSRNAVKVCDLNYEEMKDQLVYHFWNTIDELFESHYEIMKDIICIMCPPVDFKGRYVKPESDEYKVQSRTIFRNIQELLHKLPFFRRWYNDYLDSLDILDLGDTPKHIPASEMFYYNEVLDRLPSTCYSIGLMLEGLLVEVEKKNAEEDSSDITFLSKCATERREYRKLLKIRKLCNTFFNKYQFKYVPSNFTLFYQKYRPSFQLSQKKPHKVNRFEIANGNILELIALYYPKFAKQLCSSSLSYIRKAMPASLQKLCDNMGTQEAESIFNSNQYHTWSSLLRLSPEEINERLQVYMFNLLKCENGKHSTLYSELHQYFPEPARLDDTVRINRDVGVKKLLQSSSQNIYEDYNETYFQWQENLEPSLLLQKLDKYQRYFKCMDCEYIPFLDSIVVRFHDKCDKFGISSETWSKGFRSPVCLHDFFKSVIFEDPNALFFGYENLTKVPSKIEESFPIERNMNDGTVNYVEPCSTKDNVLPSANSRDAFTTRSTPYLLSAFNLNRRQEVTATSTVFRSMDGLKISVEKIFIFGVKPCLKLQLEADYHTALMYIQQYKNSKFSFHIEASSGARIVFTKPETDKKSDPPENILIVKKPPSKNQRYYIIKEIKTVGFSARLCLHKLHYLNEISLLKILNEYFPLESCSSTETLQLLDFKKSIILKSTPSLSDVRVRNNLPKIYLKVIKAINRIKRNSIPHFRIISTALHKRQYVKIAPLKITISFANGEKTLKYIPNLDTKKKIEITKCVPLKSKVKESVDKVGEPSQENAQHYDFKLSLPNGLQIASEPSLDLGIFHIIQYYIPNNPDLPDEISRTFTNNGFIHIRYRDGSIKMIGVLGRCVIGELPCKATTVRHPKKIKKHIKSVTNEDEMIKRFMKLQKSVVRKVYRYQSKFIHVHTKNYLRNKMKKKEVNVSEFKKIGNSLIRNESFTGDQLCAAVDFYIPEESCRDYYTLDTATADSHSSINDDGELITIFADGTKITSWFQIDQDMIVVDEFNNIDLWDVDPDDYACNFLIPRVGGWISVQICYQYEHPQYGTVAFYNKKEIHIRLPEIEYQVRPDGSFFINIKDEMHSHITSDIIKLSTNYCKTCYKCCETTINVKYLCSNEAEAKDDEVLLQAKDTFRKVFTVDYKGICYRNDHYDSGDTKQDCKNHKIADTQKFFLFDKNFKGKMFWNTNKLQSKLIDIQNSDELREQPYLDENGEIKVYDFIKHHCVHYTDRFLMEYRHPSPPIFKYQFAKDLPKIAYTSKRQISIIPNYKQVLPLFTLIQDLRVKHPCELPLPKFENIFQLEKYLRPKSLQIKSSSTDTINMKLSPVFAGAVVENFIKLMKKVDQFEISTDEDIVHFEKKLEESTDGSFSVSYEASKPCASVDSSKHEVHPKVLYNKILQHKKKKFTKAPQRQETVQVSKLKGLVPPPVPKNSHTSLDFNQTSQVEIYGQRAATDSNFIQEIEHSNIVLHAQTQDTNRDKETSIKEVVEWKRKISTTETGSSTNISLKNIIRNTNANTRDKVTYTTTPFDLFSNACPLTQDQEVLKVSTREPAKVQRRKILSQEPLRQQFDTHGKSSKKFETLKPESKHSKVITGVQAIESYNQVYDKCISLNKDIPKDMKRFTEIRRIGEKQNLKRTSSITEFKEDEYLLPLILSPPEKKTVAHQLTSSSTHKSLPVIPTPSPVKIMQPVSLKKEEGIQSKTLKRLSREFMGNTGRSLRYVPPEIDEKIQSQFYSSRKDIGHVSQNSSIITGLVDANCQVANKDCLCLSHHRSFSKHDCSDIKLSNFRKLSKCSNKSND